MNQKERNILKLEESFRDTIENDILKQQTENKKIKIKRHKTCRFSRMERQNKWTKKSRCSIHSRKRNNRKRRKWKRKNNRAKKLLFRKQMHSRNIRR